MRPHAVIHKQRAGGKYEYWFYSDGNTYYITEKYAKRLVREGEFMKILDITLGGL